MRTDKVGRLTSVGGGDSISFARVVFRDFAEEAAFLRKMATKSAQDMGLKKWVLDVLREDGAPSRDKLAQALAIGRWVQRNIYYVHEGFETFQLPRTTLKLKAGDCDDQTLLVCSALNTIGIRNAMAILKINGKWAHIFPVALIPTRDGLHRLTLDTTLKDPIDDLVNPIEKVRASGRSLDEVKFV
jgi:hypothetical protein